MEREDPWLNIGSKYNGVGHKWGYNNLPFGGYVSENKTGEGGLKMFYKK